MPKKTEHYQLNQYEPQDSFLRTDFNEDNAKIDAALLANRPVIGTYEGTGTGTQNIELGFRPRAVFILPQKRSYYSDYPSYISMVVDGADFHECRVTDTGFAVTSGLNSKESSQSSGYPFNPYRYIAWR